MSMPCATDHETRSYLGIAGAVQQFGASPTEDLHELLQSIVLSFLTTNTTAQPANLLDAQAAMHLHHFSDLFVDAGSLLELLKLWVLLVDPFRQGYVRGNKLVLNISGGLRKLFQQ